ncbi:uncharacterized protein C2845_PM01G10210 [Panicum miliaceum]|uniref:Uncharacterized protein n=1 Tax=Panicum miliaceum TaxID=4540 RepID=A0A3L6TT67_PANMI|nr:uncharacterized protein C2845_PM01G10210 [Panicum miliaceum]
MAGGGGAGGGSLLRGFLSLFLLLFLHIGHAASSSAVTNGSVRARRGHVSSVAFSLRFYIHRIFYSSGAKDGAVAGREKEEAVTTTVSSPLTQSLPPQPSASVVLSTPSSPCASSSPFMSPLSVRSLSATPVPSSPQKQFVTRHMVLQAAVRLPYSL